MSTGSVRASAEERARPLPGDDLISSPIGSLTDAVTIQAAPRDVWPWLVQMGAGRAGWYSYDRLDNGGQSSATRVIPELQRLATGMVFPALPGRTDGFTLAAFQPESFLVLDWKAPDGARLVTWAFVLQPLSARSTRLIVRARAGPGYRFRGLPWSLTKAVAPVVHFIMQRKQLLGVASRAEKARAFRTPEGEAAFLGAYDAAMKRLWRVPYEDLEVSSRFGTTHVVASGPRDGPPLVLLHGYMATLTMWGPNVADFTRDYRVYAIDIMGQPGKSIPAEPIRDAADYATWLAETLNGLRLDCVSLAGMSYGGWLALNFAIAAPERVKQLVLLSPACLLPIARQFSLRGMLMMFFPTRLTVDSFMRWLGFRPNRADARCVFDVMRLGLKHFRIPRETLRVTPTEFSDDGLPVMRVPTLLVLGDREVIYDPAAALERGRRLIPQFQGTLVAGASHDMCFSQHRIVDARVLDFLSRQRENVPRRVVA